MTANPLDTRNVPTVQVEMERADPDSDAFYLRGLHLTVDPDTGSNYGPATIKATKGLLSTQMQVEVVERPLGKTNNKHDSDIVKVANRYGVPPHFLKSQVEHESAFRNKSFRYEPWTIDLKMLTGDATIKDDFGNRAVHGDAQHDSKKRSVEQYPFHKYAIGGPLNVVRMRAAHPSRPVWGVGRPATATPHAHPRACDPRPPSGLRPTRV